MERARRRAGELAIAGALLGLLTAAAFGPHSVHGGFHLDDWTNWANYSYAGGFGEAYATLTNVLPSANHVGLSRISVLQFAAFGDRMGFHLAFAAACGTLVAVAFYALLRTLRLRPLHAGALAALALLFPWADAGKLWITAGPTQLSLAIVLAGQVAALHALRAPGRRRAILTVAALALYALGILVYELVAGLVVASALLYRVEVPWRTALSRWPLDAGVAAATVAYVAALYPVSDVQDLGGMLDHLGVIADEALSLLASSAAPFAEGARGPVLATMAGIFAGAALLDRTAFRRWGLVALGGLAAVAAGYLMIVPGSASYRPLDPGAGNRVNLVAALGYVTVAYSTGALAVALLRRRAGGIAAVAAGTIAALALAGAYGQRVHAAGERWDRAWAEQQRLLGAMKRTLPRPSPGSTVYLTGHRHLLGGDAPTFAWVWDLDGAVKLLWDDPTLRGQPILRGATLTCGPRTLHPNYPGGFGLQYASPYPALLYHAGGEWAAVRSPEDCSAAARRFGLPLEKAS
jgi:hypothetical protein